MSMGRRAFYMVAGALLASCAASTTRGDSEWSFGPEATNSNGDVWRYSNCCCAARPPYTTRGCESFHQSCNPHCTQSCPTKCCEQSAGCNATKTRDSSVPPWEDEGVKYWNTLNKTDESTE